MKARRRLVALLTAGVAISLIAACSSPSDNSGKSSSPAAGGSSGANKTPIKVGIILPLSGPLSAASADYQVVTKNLGSKIPNTSTIDGRPVQIIQRDDAGTASGTASAMRQLLDQDKVDFILGPLYTAEAEAALPLSNTSKTLQIVFTGCPTCGDASKYPYAFSLESDRPSQMPSTVAAMKKVGVQKVAILESDDPSGQAYTDAFNTEAKKDGVNVVKTVHFAPNSLDLGTQASQLKSSGADAVYMASAVPADVANAAKAMEEISFNPYVFGNVAASLPAVVTNAGPTWIKKWAASGYGTNVTRPDTAQKAIDFRDMMKKVEGVSTLPSSVDTTITAYDAFMMAKTAIEATHSTDAKTLSDWLVQNGYAGGKATFKFTATQHNGMTADVQSLITPGTQEDGFPLRFGS
jgi:ABC-type branched-subunit amino acid transport system substrate-binding protein